MIPAEKIASVVEQLKVRRSNAACLNAADLIESLARELAECREGWKRTALDLDGYEGGVPAEGTRLARCESALRAALVEAQANERRNDMGLQAATHALNHAEGIRVDLERKLAARDAELAEIRTAVHASPDEPLAAVVFDVYSKLLECKAQNRAMAETMSGLVGLRAELKAAKTVKAWTASERHQYELGRAAGRADGIREAIVTLRKEYAESKWPDGGNFLDACDTLESLLTAPPPPAATCNAATEADAHKCPVHAPKPAAEPHPLETRCHEEDPSQCPFRGIKSPARKAVCGTCGGAGDAAYGACPDCAGGR